MLVRANDIASGVRNAKLPLRPVVLREIVLHLREVRMRETENSYRDPPGRRVLWIRLKYP